MAVRYDVAHAISVHERMRPPLGAMDIEFFLQQCVHGGIQGERESWRPAYAQAAIEVETEGAIHEQVYLRAADPEWFGASWIE